MVGFFRGWILTWKNLRFWNSCTKLEIVIKVWLLDKETLTIILLMILWKTRLLSSKHVWFIQYPIVSIVKMMMTIIKSLRRWKQPLLQMPKKILSWTSINLRMKNRAYQNHNLLANEHDKKRYVLVSIATKFTPRDNLTTTID